MNFNTKNQIHNKLTDFPVKNHLNQLFDPH